MTEIYNKVALVGLGLIASSISHAIRRGELAHEITGYSRSSETREKARALGICDKIYDNPKNAVKDADLGILCVPVGAMSEVVKEISSELTYAIRSKVLWKHIENGDYSLPIDNHPDTFHLGAFMKKKLISIGTFVNQNNSKFDSKPQYLLRAMATEKKK